MTFQVQAFILRWRIDLFKFLNSIPLIQCCLVHCVQCVWLLGVNSVTGDWQHVWCVWLSGVKLRDVVPAVLPSIGPGDCGDWSPSSVLIAPQSAGASFVKVSDQSIFSLLAFYWALCMYVCVCLCMCLSLYVCVCNMHLWFTHTHVLLQEKQAVISKSQPVF